MYYQAKYVSPVGEITLVSRDGTLVGSWLAGQKYYMTTLGGSTVEKEDEPVLLGAKEWLDRYFAGERPGTFAFPMAPAGSAFRQQVWRLLEEISYGEVVTYGELARKMAQKMGVRSMSAQAIGGAVGHNPISIIIPCHRVVGADGSLTGYAGGTDVKAWLLEHERK